MIWEKIKWDKIRSFRILNICKPVFYLELSPFLCSYLLGEPPSCHGFFITIIILIIFPINIIMTLLQWPNLNLNFWNSLWSRVFWTHDQMTFTQYTNIPPIPLNPTHFFPKYEIWSKVDFWCRVPLWMWLNWTVMLSTTGNGRWPGIYYLSRGREEGQPAKSQTFPLVAEKEIQGKNLQFGYHPYWKTYWLNKLKISTTTTHIYHSGVGSSWT